MIGIGRGGRAENAPRRGGHRAQRGCRRLHWLPRAYRRFDHEQGTDRLGMTHEVERCRAALERAVEGKTVALVSSGETVFTAWRVWCSKWPGRKSFRFRLRSPRCHIGRCCRGSAGCAAHAGLCYHQLERYPRPLGDDSRKTGGRCRSGSRRCSLQSEKPKRTSPLEKASAIFRKYRPDGTPVGIASEVGRDGQRVILTDLAHFLEADIGMKSVVIIGNKTSKSQDGRFITPRGYKL